MVSGASEIRTRAFRLLKNSLALGFILISFSLLRPELAFFIHFEIGGFTITGEMILNMVSLIFIIYFGYFILIDSKYFLDFLSNKLGTKERGRAKSVIYDVAAIISLILASQLLTPFVASVPDVGDAAATAVNVAFLAVGFVIAYHLANEIYHLMKKHVEKLIEETSKQIKQEGKKRPSKGEPK
jgi:hypothetical protein